MALGFVLVASRADCAGDAGKQSASGPTVSIAAFDGNKSQVHGWQPAVGQALSEMVVEALDGADKKFQVVAAPDSNNQQKETQPATAGPANKSSGKGVRSGAPSGNPSSDVAGTSQKSDLDSSPDSDLVLCGTVMEFAMVTNSSRVGDFISSSSFANLGAKLVTAHVQIAWRLVDTENKRVIKRGTAATSATGSEFDMASATAGAEKTDAASGESAAPDAKSAAGKTVASQSTKAKTSAKSKSQPDESEYANNIIGGLSKAFNSSSTPSSRPAEASDSGNARNTRGKSSANSDDSAKPAAESTADIGNTINYGNPEFIDSALGKATSKAVSSIIAQLTAIDLPESSRAGKSRAATAALRQGAGKVLAVAGSDTIIISLGSKEGFKAGDKLNLYETSDVKDEKGAVVFTDEKLVGEIKLDSVQEDRSKASYSGGATVKQGWTVKAN